MKLIQDRKSSVVFLNYINMGLLYLATSVCVILAANYFSCEQVARTVPLKRFVFEKVCYSRVKLFHDSTEYIIRHKDIFDKIRCGIECSEEIDCVAFGYVQTRMTCFLYSEWMTNTNAVCAAKTWHYGAVIIT